MSDQHGDLTATFSPTSTAAGLAGSASYTPYGMATTSGYQPESATRAITPIRPPARSTSTPARTPRPPAPSPATTPSAAALSAARSTATPTPTPTATRSPIPIPPGTCAGFRLRVRPGRQRRKVGRGSRWQPGGLRGAGARGSRRVRGPVDRAHRDRLDLWPTPTASGGGVDVICTAPAPETSICYYCYAPSGWHAPGGGGGPVTGSSPGGAPGTSLCAIYTCETPLRRPRRTATPDTDATCRAPTASHALRYSPWITSLVRDITSASSLLRNGRGIHEQVPISTVQPSGTKSSPTTNGNPRPTQATTSTSSSKTSTTSTRPCLPSALPPAASAAPTSARAREAEVLLPVLAPGGPAGPPPPPNTSPQAPAAATSPTSGGNVTESVAPETATAGGSAGQGGGNAGGGTSACDPEESGGGQQALKSLADRVRLAGRHPAAINQRVIAIGEDSRGQLHAGSSNYFDAGQRAVLRELQIGRVPPIADYHAEEEILTAIPDLVRIGISGQPPCGPEDHDCLGQLRNAGVEIEC